MSCDLKSSAPRIFFCLYSVICLTCAAKSADLQLLASSDLSKLRSIGNVALSPDNRFIAYTITIRDRPGRPSGQLWVLDLSTEKSLRLGGDQPANAPLWSPDGKWIAFRGSDGEKRGLVIAHPDSSGTTFLAELKGTNSPLPGTGKDFTWSLTESRLRLYRPLRGILRLRPPAIQ